MPDTSYYKENMAYTSFLDKQREIVFYKYRDLILKYSHSSDRILDLGCGSGTLLQTLQKNNYKKLELNGYEVSNTSIEVCKKKGLNCNNYDGLTVPERDSKYDLIGSYNVLEHVSNPDIFLAELYRLVKKKGYLIVACPNFLSVTSNYHPLTQGFKRKFNNMLKIVKKLFLPYRFERMGMTKNIYFSPDEDATILTNPIDLLKWSRKFDLRLIYWSAYSVYRPSWFRYLDIFPFKYLLGSSMFIFQKQ